MKRKERGGDHWTAKETHAMPAHQCTPMGGADEHTSSNYRNDARSSAHNEMEVAKAVAE